MRCSDDSRDFFRTANRIVRDLQRPQPAIYWADFLSALLVAYGSAGVYFSAPMFSVLQIVSFFVAGAALYRLATFMHEIVHFHQQEMVGFQLAWNLFAGIPLMMPSHFYASHSHHHNTNRYATADDGEYLPLGNGPLRDVAYFLSQVFLQPIIITLRFLLGPVSFVHPTIRKWTLERASSFVIDFRYRHPLDDRPRGWRDALELACSARAWAMIVLVAIGFHDWTRIGLLYALAIYSLGLNHIRTLSAHRYMGSGAKMSRMQQLLDSTNIVNGSWWSFILFPVGTRYHALHHLFPGLPYHNLATAHQRLMRILPADSVYRDTVYPSWWSVVRQMLANQIKTPSQVSQLSLPNCALDNKQH
jgi:fatty acid desaturase